MHVHFSKTIECIKKLYVITFEVNHCSPDVFLIIKQRVFQIKFSTRDVLLAIDYCKVYYIIL